MVTLDTRVGSRSLKNICGIALVVKFTRMMHCVAGLWLRPIQVFMRKCAPLNTE